MERRIDMEIENSEISIWECKCKLKERKEGEKVKQAGRQTDRQAGSVTGRKAYMEEKKKERGNERNGKQ